VGTVLVAALDSECFWGVVVFIVGYLPLEPELDAVAACLSPAAPDLPVGEEGLPVREWPREDEDGP